MPAAQTSSRRPAEPRRTRALAALAVLAALLLAQPASALPEDAEQPIKVVGDNVELDQTTGTLVYTGAVQLDQGTLRVTGDKLTIRFQDEVVTEVVAEGDLAHYQQVTADSGLVQADAEVITYLAQQQQVELSGQAELVQAADRFRGDFIRYDISRKLVDANSAGDGGRVEMTITPRKRDSAGNGQGDAGSGDGAP